VLKSPAVKAAGLLLFTGQAKHGVCLDPGFA